jgi:hypothetical protein
MSKLSYRITWVDARDPLFIYTKTYASMVPAIVQSKTNVPIGDATLHQPGVFAPKVHDCTEHEGRFYKPDMSFVAKCFAHLSDWRKSYARFEASGVAPVRRKNRTNPYTALEFDLNVGTNADRQAIVTVYLKPFVNGKDPIQ